MCKKADLKHKKPTDNRKISGKYVFYLIIMGMLLTALAVSVLLHIFCKKNISGVLSKLSTGWIHNVLEYIITTVHGFVSSTAIFEIAKAIGICSVFIGWMYASLDKEEIGKKYKELLDYRYKFYSWFVGIHFIAVLACMWLAKVDYLESASIAVAALLWGCILQWKAIKNIILSSAQRKRTAIKVWKCDLQKEDKQYEKLKSMAKVISTCGINRCDQLEEVFVEHVSAFLSGIECKEQSMQKALELWSSLFTNNEKSSRIFIATNIFSKLDEKNVDKEALCIISAAYVLWIHNHFVANKKSGKRLPEKEIVINEISNEYSAVKIQTNGIPNPELWNYSNAAVSILTWMYFTLYLIGFSEKLATNTMVEATYCPIYQAMALNALSERGGDYGFSKEEQKHAFMIAFGRVERQS